MPFSWLNWYYGFLEGKPQSISIHHITLRVYNINMIYRCSYWSWSSHWNSTCFHIWKAALLFPLFHTVLFGRKSLYVAPNLKSGNLWFPIFEAINYLEFAWKEYYLLSIYLFIHSTIYISKDSWIFILYFGLFIQSYFIYYVAQIIAILTFENSFKRLLWPLTLPHQCRFCCFICLFEQTHLVYFHLQS